MSSQAVFELSLPDSIDATGIYLDKDGFLYIIERHGIYELNGGRLSKINDIPFTTNHIGSTVNGHSGLIVKLVPQGFLEFTPNRKIYTHNLPVNHAILNKINNREYILASSKLYSFQNDAWYFTSNFDKDYLPAEGPIQNNIYFNNNSVVQINQQLLTDTLLLLDGSQKVTALWTDKTHVYLAQDKRLGKANFDNKGITGIEWHNSVFDEEVLQLISVGDRMLLRTITGIYSIDTDFQDDPKCIAKLKEGEEWLSLLGYTDQSFWALNNKKIQLFEINSIQSTVFKTRNMQSPLYPFRVGEHYYISDGDTVYKYDKKQNSWSTEKGKEAPNKIFMGSDGDPVLVFDGKIIKIDHLNGLINEYMVFPKDPVLDYVHGATESFVLQSKRLIVGRNGKQRAIKLDYEIEALAFGRNMLFGKSKMSVYKWQDNYFEEYYRHERLIQDFKVLENGLLILDEANNLSHIIPETEEIQSLELKLKDSVRLFENDGHFCFSSGPIFKCLDAKNLADGLKTGLSPSLQLFNTSSSQVMGLQNNEVWVRDSLSVFVKELASQLPIRKPSIYLDYDDKKEMIKLHHTNHWTNDIKFNYHLSGKNTDETIWTDENEIGISNANAAVDQVYVRMNDDVFGIDSCSYILGIPQNRQAINLWLYLLGLLSIFACGFSGMRLLKSN